MWPAFAEQGHEFVEVAAIRGWQEYDFPGLRYRGSVPPSFNSREPDKRGNSTVAFATPVSDDNVITLDATARLWLHAPDSGNQSGRA